MPAGRPTKYKPEYVEQAKKLTALGAKLEDLAEFWGVNLSTVTLWQKQKPDFDVAIKTARRVKDSQVERSLLERATGYSHPETRVIVIDGKAEKVEITKHYPPDTTACIFWLKNRQPQDWRDKRDVHVSTSLEDLVAGSGD